MRRTRKWVIFLILFLVVVSFWYLLPSIRYWSLSDQEKQQYIDDHRLAYEAEIAVNKSDIVSEFDSSII